jgi:hypothetical protein
VLNKTPALAVTVPHVDRQAEPVDALEAMDMFLTPKRREKIDVVHE